MATKPAPPSPQKVLENDEDQTHGQMDGSWGKRVEIWDEEQQVGGEDDQFEMRSRVPHDSEPMAASVSLFAFLLVAELILSSPQFTQT